MVQKRGIGDGNAEEGKRPKGNESDEDDSQPPPTNDDDLMRSLEVSDHASTEYRAGCTTASKKAVRIKLRVVRLFAFEFES